MEFKNMVFDTDSEDEYLKKFNLKKAEEKLDRVYEKGDETSDNDDDYHIVPLLNKCKIPMSKKYHEMSNSDNENDEKINIVSKLNKSKSPKSKKEKNKFIENEHEMSNSDNEDKINIVSKLKKSKSPKSKKHDKKNKFIENDHEDEIKANKKSGSPKLNKPYKSKEYIEDNSETSDSNNDEKVNNSALKTHKKIKNEIKSPKSHEISKTSYKSKEYIEDNSETSDSSDNEEKVNNSASKIHKKIKNEAKSPKNHEISKTSFKSKEYIEDNSETSDSNDNDDKASKIHKKIKTEAKSPKNHEVSKKPKKSSPTKSVKQERSELGTSSKSSSDENQETDNSKPENTRVKAMITDYMSTLKDYVKSPYQSTVDLNSLDSEDEIYIIHCPKKLNVTELRDSVVTFSESKRIKLEDKKIEWNLIKSESFVNLIGTQNNNLVNKSIKISGVVNLSLQLKKNGSVTFNSIKSDKVPIPADLKMRHPIFGLNYKKSLQLDDDVNEKLKSAEKNKLKINKKILKNSLNKYVDCKNSDQKMSEEFTNFLSDLTSNLNVKVKKEVVEEDVGFVKKKKKNKRKLIDDISEHKKSKRMKFL